MACSILLLDFINKWKLSGKKKRLYWGATFFSLKLVFDLLNQLSGEEWNWNLKFHSLKCLQSVKYIHLLGQRTCHFFLTFCSLTGSSWGNQELSIGYPLYRSATYRRAQPAEEIRSTSEKVGERVKLAWEYRELGRSTSCESPTIVNKACKTGSFQEEGGGRKDQVSKFCSHEPSHDREQSADKPPECIPGSHGVFERMRAGVREHYWFGGRCNEFFRWCFTCTPMNWSLQ